ncbi:MAG TPA: PrsW family glutamic-type intramembrane protease [Candidatus Thermoplasmatota archaeon]|nr:PrsW family glutamic-type intramembrane protease [Candidatus Thermoplasmatota archaeon]
MADPGSVQELFTAANGLTLLLSLVWSAPLLFLWATWRSEARYAPAPALIPPAGLLAVGLLIGLLTPGPVPPLRLLLGAEATFPAALLEELLKGLGTFVVLATLARRGRPGIQAGLLAGAAVGLGFALTENLVNSNGSADVLVVALQRGLVANPGHMVYTAAFGAGLVLLLWGRALPHRAVGAGFLVLAPVAHALHNFLVVAAFAQGEWTDVAASAGFLSVVISLEALLLNLVPEAA